LPEVRHKKLLLEEQNNTIIFSAHDLGSALKVADKVWLLKNETSIEAAPEDLMLKGSFADFFLTKNLVFNNAIADFQYKQNCKFPIYANCDEDCYEAMVATEHCLRRNDFYFSEKKIDLTLKISKKNGNFVWYIEYKNNSSEFNTVYELSLYLKNLKITTL